MRRLVTLSLTGLLLTGAAGVANATPGPNGNNDKGLCTAYFNGSENGRAHKRQAPPFRETERQAEERYAENHADEDGNVPEHTVEQAVAEVCGVQFDEDGNVTDDGLVGGNPDYSETPEPSKGGNPHDDVPRGKKK